MSNVVHKHILRVARKSIQGGIPNERYPTEYLTNYRLLYVHPTDAILKLKEFTLATKDAKFYDAVSACGQYKAEGKCIGKREVNFNPSKNTGSGRSFKQCDLDACFDLNAFYFLYEVASYDDRYITFHIYWVPIAIIRQWYQAQGSKGKIPVKKLRQCLNQAVTEQTTETRG